MNVAIPLYIFTLLRVFGALYFDNGGWKKLAKYRVKLRTLGISVGPSRSATAVLVVSNHKGAMIDLE